MSPPSPAPGQVPLPPERVLSIEVVLPLAVSAPVHPAQALAQCLGLPSSDIPKMFGTGPTLLGSDTFFMQPRKDVTERSAAGAKSKVSTRNAVTRAAFLVQPSAHSLVLALLEFVSSHGPICFDGSSHGFARVRAWAGSGPAPGTVEWWVVRLPKPATGPASSDVLLPFVEQGPQLVMEALTATRRFERVLSCAPLFLEEQGAIQFVGLVVSCLPRARPPAATSQDAHRPFNVRVTLPIAGTPTLVTCPVSSCFPSSRVFPPSVLHDSRLTWERLALDGGLEPALEASVPLFETLKAALLSPAPLPAASEADTAFVRDLARKGAAATTAARAARRSARAPASGSAPPGLPPRAPRTASPSPARTPSFAAVVAGAAPAPLAPSPSPGPTPSALTSALLEVEQGPELPEAMAVDGDVRAPTPGPLAAADEKSLDDVLLALVSTAAVPSPGGSRTPSRSRSLPASRGSSPGPEGVRKPAPLSLPVKRALSLNSRGGRLMQAVFTAASSSLPPAAPPPPAASAQATAAQDPGLGHGPAHDLGHGHAQAQGDPPETGDGASS